MAQNSPKSTKSRSRNASRIAKVSQVLNQARESLKLLETLEKETIARARTFVRNPLQADLRRKLANERVLATLRSWGVATRSEVEALEQRVDHLSSEVSALHALLAEAASRRDPRGTGRETRDSSKEPQPPAEAFPNT